MLKNIPALLFLLLTSWVLVIIDAGQKKEYPEDEFFIAQKESYVSGTFKGKGEGFVSDIIVEVEIKGIKEKPYYLINDIRVTEFEDLETYFKEAEEKVIERVLEKQKTDIDVVTRASYSRDGILEAIEDAIKQAVKRD